MTPDATTIPEALGNESDAPPEAVVASAVREATTGSMNASLSAIASAQAGSIDATGSAIGMAKVDGDAEAHLSVVGFMSAKGNATMRQSYSSAFVASDELKLSQAVSAMSIARTVTFEQSAAVLSMSSNAEVKGGFIGILLSPKANIAEDTRILIGGRGLLVIALALLGGFGLVAVAIMYGAERFSSWRPDFSLPELPSWAKRS